MWVNYYASDGKLSEEVRLLNDATRVGTRTRYGLRRARRSRALLTCGPSLTTTAAASNGHAYESALR